MLFLGKKLYPWNGWHIEGSRSPKGTPEVPQCSIMGHPMVFSSFPHSLLQMEGHQPKQFPPIWPLEIKARQKKYFFGQKNKIQGKRTKNKAKEQNTGQKNKIQGKKIKSEAKKILFRAKKIWPIKNISSLYFRFLLIFY